MEMSLWANYASLPEICLSFRKAIDGSITLCHLSQKKREVVHLIGVSYGGEIHSSLHGLPATKLLK